MPRRAESEESRILSYFQEAPLGEAKLLLGLSQGVVKERSPAPFPKKKGRPASKATEVRATPEQKEATSQTTD